MNENYYANYCKKNRIVLRKKDAEAKKLKYKQRKRRGICTKCGKRPICSRSKSRCATCRSYDLQWEHDKFNSKPWVAGKPGRPPKQLTSVRS